MRRNPGLPKINFVVQSLGMEPNWAADHLQAIRTLMERSAVYRRALAPVMIVSGCLGLAGSILSLALSLETAAAFSSFRLIVGGLALATSFLLVRRQALQD